MSIATTSQNPASQLTTAPQGAVVASELPPVKPLTASDIAFIQAMKKHLDQKPSHRAERRKWAQGGLGFASGAYC